MRKKFRAPKKGVCGFLWVIFHDSKPQVRHHTCGIGTGVIAGFFWDEKSEFLKVPKRWDVFFSSFGFFVWGMIGVCILCVFSFFHEIVTRGRM